MVWDRKTGKPIHNAIVWQDRRGAPLCRKLIDDGWEPKIQAKTGLLIDSYFSATKVALAAGQRAGRAGGGASAANSPSAPSTASCCGA